MYVMNRLILTFLIAFAAHSILYAQEGAVENRPYTDLRPFHFGIIVGTHLQDMTVTNVGPQVITMTDGSSQQYNITADQDSWDNGFQVGVLGELRLSQHFQLRAAPTLYFGSRHFSFINHALNTDDAMYKRTQTMKTVYLGCAFDLIFAGKRNGNQRPYMLVGLTPSYNLTSKSSDYIKLKQSDLFLEAGVGFDFYLPYFKLRPELKFMYGLGNVLDTKHPERLRDESKRPYAMSVNDARSKMIALTFYFE